MIIIVKVREDLTGRKFGRLKVIEQAEDVIDKSGRHYPMWKCICDCTAKTIVYIRGDSLKGNKTQSCGCLNKEITSKMMSKKMRKTNKYEIHDNVGICYATNNNKKILFDTEDYYLLEQYTWMVNSDNNGYQWVRAHNIPKDGDMRNFTSKSIAMSRLIMLNGRKDYNNSSIHIDHINNNPCDNRKCNLRFATRSTNEMNKGIRNNNTSGFTGVTWREDMQKWTAQIAVNGKVHHLGSFSLIEDAIKARKEAEEKYFGEYSYDNSQKQWKENFCEEQNLS